MINYHDTHINFILYYFLLLLTHQPLIHFSEFISFYVSFEAFEEFFESSLYKDSRVISRRNNANRFIHRKKTNNLNSQIECLSTSLWNEKKYTTFFDSIINKMKVFCFSSLKYTYCTVFDLLIICSHRIALCDAFCDYKIFSREKTQQQQKKNNFWWWLLSNHYCCGAAKLVMAFSDFTPWLRRAALPIQIGFRWQK